MRNRAFHLLIGTTFPLLVVAGLWQARSLANARQAEFVVRKALQVRDQLPYTCTKITRNRVKGKWVEVKAMVARRPPNLRRIHYVTAPLSGVTVWQNSAGTFRYEPKTRQLSIYDRSPRREDDEALLMKNYQPQLEGEENVAGRPAYRVRLAPRHAGDAWKRLWIDKERYLRLGSEDYDGSGRLLRRTRIEEIQFDNLDADQFRPSDSIMRLARRTYSDEEQRKSIQQVERAVGFPILLPGYVSEGYRFEGAYTYPCECGCQKPAAQILWSNGLNTISMFQCGQPCGKGDACSLAAGSYRRSVHTHVGSASVLFVGECRRAELEKMARSFSTAVTRRS